MTDETLPVRPIKYGSDGATPGFKAEWELIPDAAYGHRGWGVDKLGRLHPMHALQSEVWRPGVNTADCAQLYRDHNIEDCTCGFYSYHSGHKSPYKGADITGVVRVSGKTVVGDKGFRSEKAEIVALALPRSVITSRLSETVVSALWSLGGLALIMQCVFYISFLSDNESGWITLGGVVSMMLGLFGLFVAVAGLVGIKDEIDRRRHGIQAPPSMARFALVERNYPNVKIFYSHKKMLKAFPPSKFNTAQAMTPDDPDFWTVTV